MAPSDRIRLVAVTDCTAISKFPFWKASRTVSGALDRRKPRSFEKGVFPSAAPTKPKYKLSSHQKESKSLKFSVTTYSSHAKAQSCQENPGSAMKET